MPSPLPYAHGGPVATGQIRLQPEDFIVEEILGFEPTGAGEHIFLQVQKRGENTDFVARQIAKYAGLPRMAVSHAGLKDRHAITTQWFGVHLPGKREIAWDGLESDNVKVLQAVRHNRKLKTGALKGNRFVLTVRNVEGERTPLATRLEQVKSLGVPNYFGPQRFGHGGNNLLKAEALFQGELQLRDRTLEGIYLSAARSEIFNRVLAKRVASGQWNQAMDGDVFMFEGSHSIFRAELSEDTLQRVATQNIHPSGPLWGKGEMASTGTALALELDTAAECPVLRTGLERMGMEPARRPLRLMVADLTGDFLDDTTLRLSFSLPAGAYATVVLRELIEFAGSLE